MPTGVYERKPRKGVVKIASYKLKSGKTIKAHKRILGGFTTHHKESDPHILFAWHRYLGGKMTLGSLMKVIHTLAVVWKSD